MTTLSSRNGTKAKSTYLEYLPALYRDDDFMGKFLFIFEDIVQPIDAMIGNLSSYFDPRFTPEPLLTWLATWLDMNLDASLPLERRRELVQNAAELYRWRGTKKGLSEYLRICTGSVPEITEYIPGMRLGPETRLGENTKLGSGGTGYHFTVNIEIGENIDPRLVKTIIESQKPAHTSYTLRISRRP